MSNVIVPIHDQRKDGFECGNDECDSTLRQADRGAVWFNVLQSTKISVPMRMKRSMQLEAMCVKLRIRVEG